jgi:hypothetical protein
VSKGCGSTCVTCHPAGHDIFVINAKYLLKQTSGKRPIPWDLDRQQFPEV